MKEKLFSYIENISKDLVSLADFIFDHPELGCEEYESSTALCEFLNKNGFKVTRGVGTLETAFRAEYQSLSGGPSIGLLCEYDALYGLGHACGHHMQGPCAVGAALALKDELGSKYPFKLVVYGCPDEEGHSVGGKTTMIKNGCFNDIDIAMIMHGGTETTTDLRTLAAVRYEVIFSDGNGAEPNDNSSASRGLDAMLLAFQGVEFLREHIADDARMHYTYLPEEPVAEGEYKAEFSVRAKSVSYHEHLKNRFIDVINGAAMMCSASVKIKEGNQYYPKIPIQVLVDSFYENAELAGAQRIEGVRKRVGSSDFGNVIYKLPGIGIRIAFAPKNTSVHSREWLDLGKSDSAHEAVKTGAKTLAAMAFDFISNPELIAKAKQEHKKEVQSLDDNTSVVVIDEAIKGDFGQSIEKQNVTKFHDNKAVVDMTFSGRSSHAAAAPDLGRSGFDALQIAIAAIEYLGKHLKNGTQINYSICSSGGMPCNVVPDNAKGRFELNMPDGEMLKWAIERLESIAQGAALVTGTKSNVIVSDK
ncbi:MAG: M20/M25/M40 family metallo-hydrolase [Bacillota bacterium]|nr:peptidase dimerization domain-containing protein [Bacillota bacterium]MDD3297626.1 peptidase dimerization domain-containing protein [Bacillota bacterium]MDD3850865.1 peptidase dimerization domain-containing protein [Bacillota bacterium]MDD4707477.1 peptidase dimerization domain-containing protein [Bacillota bacterium]